MTDNPRDRASTLIHSRRVEKMVRKLSGGQFDNAESLWTFQTDLLELQRDLQSSITASKKLPSTERDYTTLERLRDLRAFSRLLGDSFAWKVLRMDSRLIQSLSENAPVPISEDAHGSLGMLTIATHLSSEGWGFPLIHDITDCLRIGDITFVNPSANGTRVKTVETKTRLESEEINADGKSSRNYTVSVIHPARDPDDSKSSTHPSETLDRMAPKRKGTRVERQVRRMSRAHVKQSANWDSVTRLPGEAPLFATTFNSQHQPHWKSLRRVIRHARASGYASECVDNAFLYVAFYNDEGDTSSSIQNSNLLKDLTDSPIMSASRWGHENSIVLTSIPRENKWARVNGYNFRPFFLYDIPQIAMSDVIHGRLALAVIWNPARIFDHLRTAGFDLQTHTSTGQPDPSIVFTTKFEDSSGATWNSAQHNLIWHVHEIVSEFKSLHFLTEVATTMSAAAVAVFQSEYADGNLNPPAEH